MSTMVFAVVTNSQGGHSQSMPSATKSPRSDSRPRREIERQVEIRWHACSDSSVGRQGLVAIEEFRRRYKRGVARISAKDSEQHEPVGVTAERDMEVLQADQEGLLC